MARSWLVNSRAIAKKVRNATTCSDSEIKDYGANRECPNCHCFIDNSDVSQEWPGLPAGVKFDPSHEELIQHLEAKCGIGNSKSHMFIDEFIPTLECDEGICYTHPENLPGVKKDGSSIHFFHRTMNAYSRGQRKRRKICSQNGIVAENVRWHKTGESKPVMRNGVLIAYRKIMVLKGSEKGCKTDTSNWKMYQYHLGTDECEKSGEYVVSKIFYENKKKGKDESSNSPFKDLTTLPSPRTPKRNRQDLPRGEKSFLPGDAAESRIIQQAEQDADEAIPLPENDKIDTDYQAGESQLPENFSLDLIDDSLLCKEAIESLSQYNNGGEPNQVACANTVNKTDGSTANEIAPARISEFEQLDFDTPLDFLLNAELPFGSQESIFDWLDHL